MNRKRIKLPQAAKQAFLNVARSNTDVNGRLKETLCFLAGHEEEDKLVVTDLIFPVQNSTAAKVDDLGICGQDSALWISQWSPAAKAHGSNFRIIAWVHSHVQGALCGFSSIDVHSQYAYKTLYQGWDVYGLVHEIRDDGSSVSAWLDITEEGQNVISSCQVTQVQHGSCSSKDFYTCHNHLVDEAFLPLTVVDARNTAALGSEVAVNSPSIHTLCLKQTEENFHDHDVCKACGKYLGDLKRMVGHIGHSKKCKAHYGKEYECMRQKRRSESVKTYNSNNAVKIAEKQKLYYDKADQTEIAKKRKKYNMDNRESINQKQETYNKINQAKIRQKQKKYNVDNKQEIRQNQRLYNNINQSQIKENQAIYNKTNAGVIKEKQASYNKEHQEEIREKQAVYDKEHQEKIVQKQRKYDKANQDHIVQKQRKYDKANQDQIVQKQRKYDKANQDQIVQKQRKYNKVNQEQIKMKQQEYNRENKEIIQRKQKVYDATNRDSVNIKQTVYNANNQEKIAKKQRKYNDNNRDVINTKQAQYNKENAAVIAKKETKRKAAKRNACTDFNSQIAAGPIFPCICCHRLLFSCGVVPYSSEEELRKVIDEDLLDISIQTSEKMYSREKIYLCVNCNLLLKKGVRPCISVHNGLSLDDIPDDLILTELEEQLIAKRLLFMKIHLLPRSRMPAMKDRIINVPLESEDIFQTVSSLPRKPDEAGLITVKFKRMKKLKSSHIQAFIRPAVLNQALQKLRNLGHPDYQFSFVQDESNDIIEISSSSDENSDDENMDKQREAVHELYNASTCLVHENLESEIVVNNDQVSKIVNSGGDTIELAPGEGKIPTNILSEENLDIKAFPSLFPTGKYGCDYKREQTVSKQKYFNQRLLNVDNRFCRSPTYLFAAQHKIGRASWRGRVLWYGVIAGGGVRV